ncbi:MAG: DUF5696 domain-containing protein [Spirochaetales bacterium]
MRSCKALVVLALFWLGAGLSGAGELASNAWSQPETDARRVDPARLKDWNGYDLLMEDQTLSLWLRKTDGSLRIRDKTSGYAWGGLANDSTEGLNRSWRGMATSLLSFDYVDLVNNEKITSLADTSALKTYQVSGRTLTVKASFPKLSIDVTVRLTLDNGRLKIALRDTDIHESGEFLVTSVYFLPFLGSVRGNELPGYVLLPDGPGALVRFRAPTHYLAPYRAKVWGKDYDLDSMYEFDDSGSNRPKDYRVEEARVQAPVFGLVHGVGQYALFGRITQGAPWAEIVCSPAGVTTDWTWATAHFAFRQKYLQPVDRQGGAIETGRHPMQPVQAELEYSFLHGAEADWTGMARLWRQQLAAEGALPSGERRDTASPVKLEFVVSEAKRGFLADSVLDLTKAADVTGFLAALGPAVSPTVVLSGWQAQGLHGAPLSGTETRYSKDNLALVASATHGLGGRLLFQDSSLTASRRQVDVSRDAARSLSGALMVRPGLDPSAFLTDVVFVKPSVAALALAAKLPAYRALGADGIDLGTYTSSLFGDRSEPSPRQQSLVTLTAPLKTAGVKLSGSSPSSALWRWLAEAYDQPLVSSRFLYETDTVPFVSLVLKGSLDLYAPPSNEGWYSDTSVLRLIDYGLYPAFRLTGVENAELADTPLADLWSTRTSDWLTRTREITARVGKALLPFEGQRIVAREVPAEGVVKVTYERGVLWINYGKQAWTGPGVVVPATGFVVQGGAHAQN